MDDIVTSSDRKTVILLDIIQEHFNRFRQNWKLNFM